MKPQKRNIIFRLLKFSIPLLLLTLVISCKLFERSTKPDKPTNLRIQNQTEQIGIDLHNPKFAWYVNDKDRGEIQTAYRILVASSQQNIDANIGDVWDSEKVISSEQYGIQYNGIALISNTKYWWKVATWDNENKQSPWSDRKIFITGVMHDSEWSANWIKSTNNRASVPYMLRKPFEIEKNVDYAIANICGIGQFELRINGNKVGDHELDPGWTEYTKSLQYVTFDVTEFLKKEDNTIGVWLADGFMDLRNSGGRYQGYSEHSDGEKRMIMELNIVYADGTSEKILSDSTWKTATGSITYSNVFGGEDYDSRYEKEGWDKTGYDDSDWERAETTTSPGGVLCSQVQPPIRVVEELEPTNMIQKGDTIIVNFGKTYAGFFDITIKGDKGQSIKVTMDDGTGNFNTYCQYTLKGGVIETFRPKFFYWGQNTIVVQGASLSSSDLLPQLLNVKGYVVCSSAKPVGIFKSSDTLYNSIFAINKQGIMSNLYSCVTDCPHREKAAWMNDLNFTSPSFPVLFDVYTLFKKINKDITESQKKTGWIPSMCPYYREPIDSNNVFTCSPFYDITAMRIPWIMYHQYGDLESLRQQYNVAKDALAYLTFRSNGNLIGYGLGDWIDPDPVDKEFIETCVYYDFVNTMQKWASILGKTYDADKFRELAKNIKKAFNLKFFNYRTQNYGSQQTANAVPLHHGMVPEGKEIKVLNALIRSIEDNNYSINCGQNAHGYMLQVLSIYGRDDLVGRIHTNLNGPSFGHWVAQGKTNTPESWTGGGSQQHHMNNTIPEWICKNLAGISPLKPGFEEISIRPTFATSYIPKEVSYSLETIRGNVNVSWVKTENSYSLDVTIPVNCTAKIHIPTFGAQEVSIVEGQTELWHDGHELNNVKEISYKGTEGIYPSTSNYVIFNLGSGKYYFKSVW